MVPKFRVGVANFARQNFRPIRYMLITGNAHSYIFIFIHRESLFYRFTAVLSPSSFWLHSKRMAKTSQRTGVSGLRSAWRCPPCTCCMDYWRIVSNGKARLKKWYRFLSCTYYFAKRFSYCSLKKLSTVYTDQNIDIHPPLPLIPRLNCIFARTQLYIVESEA